MAEIPCPRFEFRWEKDGESWEKCVCKYSLVIPVARYDIRSNDGELTEITLKIGTTKVGRGNNKRPVWDNGIVETPFRDGAHAQWDCESLGGHIPIVAICEDVHSIVEYKPTSK